MAKFKSLPVARNLTLHQVLFAPDGHAYACFVEKWADERNRWNDTLHLLPFDAVEETPGGTDEDISDVLDRAARAQQRADDLRNTAEQMKRRNG